MSYWTLYNFNYSFVKVHVKAIFFTLLSIVICFVEFYNNSYFSAFLLAQATHF